MQSVQIELLVVFVFGWQTAIKQCNMAPTAAERFLCAVLSSCLVLLYM